jgi:hypothetical protein
MIRRHTISRISLFRMPNAESRVFRDCREWTLAARGGSQSVYWRGGRSPFASVLGLIAQFGQSASGIAGFPVLFTGILFLSTVHTSGPDKLLTDILYVDCGSTEGAVGMNSPILPNGVPYDEEMHIIGARAVVFLTIFILMYGLFPEDFIKKIKPAMIAFRLSQIMLSLLVILPEKEMQVAEEQKKKVATKRLRL